MLKFAVPAMAMGLAAPAAAEVRQVAPDGDFRAIFQVWQSGEGAAPPSAPAVVVSKAADALGRPIDLSRVAVSGASRESGALASAVSLPTLRPLASAVMTSGFGIRRHPLLRRMRAHLGVDLAAPTGTPVQATSDGVVSVADWNGGYGLYVALEHGGGIQTRYGHLSRLNVASGQRVRKGEIIGFVGSTGRSTGPHLHYETRVNGQAMNPALLIGR